MPSSRDEPKRDGSFERASAAPPRPGGRGFRLIVGTLLAISTVALVAVSALLGLVLLELRGMSNAASLKGDIGGIKTEVAALHADMTKSMTALQKGLSETSSEVNSATVELNDIALSLHKKP